MNCSKEHGRCINTTKKVNELPSTVYLCYHNEATEKLSKLIRNNIILVVCENHREDYVHDDGIPLTMDAYNARMNDLFKRDQGENVL